MISIRKIGNTEFSILTRGYASPVSWKMDKFADPFSDVINASRLFPKGVIIITAAMSKEGFRVMRACDSVRWFVGDEREIGDVFHWQTGIFLGESDDIPDNICRLYGCGEIFKYKGGSYMRMVEVMMDVF